MRIDRYIGGWAKTGSYGGEPGLHRFVTTDRPAAGAGRPGKQRRQHEHTRLQGRKCRVLRLHAEAEGGVFPPGGQTIQMVQDRATYRDFDEGQTLKTGNPLDLALLGNGFFSVSTPRGT